MKLLPYSERKKSLILPLLEEILGRPVSKDENWGRRMVSRRSRLGYMYDVMPPLTMEDALPEELL